MGIQEAPEALLTKLPVLEPQILPLLSPESVCVCVCLPRPVLVDFSLLFSDSFSVLCARAPMHGAGSQCLPFRVHLLSLVSACLLCVFLSLSYYVPASLPLCPAFLHSLYLCLDLFWFLSLSRPGAHPVRPPPPPPASTRGLRVSVPSLACLLTLGSCSQLPNPGLSCPPLLSLGGGE